MPRRPDRVRALEKYARLAPRYDRWNALLAAYRRSAVRLVRLQPGDVVLDVGCGTGLSFADLEQAIGADGRLIGIEQSPEMLGVARSRVEAAGWSNVTFVEAPAQEANVPVPADGALFFFTHDILRSRDALENVVRQVKPGGRIVAAGAKRAPLWAPPLNLIAWIVGRRYVTTLEGASRPWSHLEGLLSNVTVRSAAMGLIYVAVGMARTSSEAL